VAQRFYPALVASYMFLWGWFVESLISRDKGTGEKSVPILLVEISEEVWYCTRLDTGDQASVYVSRLSHYMIDSYRRSSPIHFV
jgi:hypothetical protein